MPTEKSDELQEIEERLGKVEKAVRKEKAAPYPTTYPPKAGVATSAHGPMPRGRREPTEARKRENAVSHAFNDFKDDSTSVS